MMCVYYHPKMDDLFIGSENGSTVWIFIEGLEIYGTATASYIKSDHFIYIGEL